MHADEMRQLIDAGEGLTTAFARRVSAAYINERAVIELMACMANGAGGTLLIGVDANGAISGCHPFHGDRTDPAALAMTIRRNTSPALAAEVSVAELDGRDVVALTVEAQPSPVATRWGVYRTRRLNAKGVPECAGMDPAYLFTRYRDANGIDWALAPATGASDTDIDPDAISSYRRLVARFGGDDELAQLSDDALVRSLGFHDDSAEPVKLGAIALFGTPEAIARHLPYHQLVVVDRRGPAATHRSASPLAPMVEGLAGLEALPLVLNALMHRDYTLPGAVYVRLEQTRTNVTSPGGMARGPRSLYLTTALARTGITTGAGEGLRGLDVDYTGSHEQGVSATLRERLGENERLALDAVQLGDGVSRSDVATATGLSTQQAYRALKKLTEAGRVRRVGSTRTTRYLPA